jgi:hypothetical protein
MTKERELLKRCFEYIYPSFESNLICDEIEELLAQAKPEPMTGKEISQGFRADKDATNAESYWAGVALAEKHHGVTGENK